MEFFKEQGRYREFMLKVYAVCPGGVGTSLVLKQNLITLFEQRNIPADVGFLGGWEVADAEFDLCFVIGYVYQNVLGALEKDDARRERIFCVTGVMDMDELGRKVDEALAKFSAD